MSGVLALARPDILALEPYRHAAWDPSLERMHANEMPWPAPGDDTGALHRYPEPQPAELIAHLAALYGVAPPQVLAGRGSDEAIDLLVRAFCRAGHDAVVVCPPTFGMYAVAAGVQGAAVIEVPLVRERSFALDAAGVLQACRGPVKLVFLCSPNNPTGNLLDAAAVEQLCTKLAGRALVVLDEAYVEMSGAASFSARLAAHDNLVVLRTLSKAYALAGARCGVLLGHADVVSLLRRIIPPYALPAPTIDAALRLTRPEHRAELARRVEVLRAERGRLAAALERCPLVQRVFPSDANFLLVECRDAQRVLDAVASVGLLVRDLRRAALLGEHVRISVGTPEQNARLLAALERASGETA